MEGGHFCKKWKKFPQMLLEKWTRKRRKNLKNSVFFWKLCGAVVFHFSTVFLQNQRWELIAVGSTKILTKMIGFHFTKIDEWHIKIQRRKAPSLVCFPPYHSWASSGFSLDKSQSHEEPGNDLGRKKKLWNMRNIDWQIDWLIAYWDSKEKHGQNHNSI